MAWACRSVKQLNKRRPGKQRVESGLRRGTAESMCMVKFPHSYIVRGKIERQRYFYESGKKVFSNQFFN